MNPSELSVRKSSEFTIDPNDQSSAEFRQSLLEVNGGRLSEMAWRAINVRHQPVDGFVVVCIHVADDNIWRELVEMLMPDNEQQWQALRDKGDIPLARGSASAYVSEVVAGMFPELKEVIAEPPPEGFARCYAMSHQGVTVADIMINPPKEKS